MNHNMFHNPIVQENIEKLRRYGYEIVAPDHGMLANGDDGDGRMPEPEILLKYILREIYHEKDLAGKKVLVTAGATREAIDPVRYITNHSTGKMGFALAEAAAYRGAEVTLIYGKTEAEFPMFVKPVSIFSAEDMFNAVKSAAPEHDIIIKAAAVADYRPAEIADEKIKKSDSELSIKLERTKDILGHLGEHKRDGQILCGFAMETSNVIANAEEKLKRKNLDLICANSLRQEGAGFGSDTNIITVITRDGKTELGKMTKFEAANAILDIISAKTHQ